MFNNAVSEDIIDSKLYVKNLSESIRAIKATPDPAGFSIAADTSEAAILLLDFPEGIIVLFLTQ